MADFPNIEPDLEGIALIANNQIYDSILTGETQTASLSGAKWQCTPTFSNRNGKEARDLRAFIFNQSGVSGRFNYYPASIDNVGTHAGAGVINGADQVGSELITRDWDADQELLFAAGDYLTVNGEMKMVTTDVAVGQDYIEYDETNYMPSPFDPEGWYGATSDPDGSITNVTINNPSGQSFAGLAEQVTTNNFTMLRSGNIPVVLNDTVYFSLVVKTDSIDEMQVSLIVDGAYYDYFIISLTTGELTVSNGASANSTYLNNDFILINISYPCAFGSGDIRIDAVLKNVGGAVPPIGSQIYVQAAFFGKADDWPAKLRANATIPITPPLRTSPAHGALIEADNPYFPARLESDDQSTLQVSAPVIYNSTFSIVEAF